MYEQYKQKCTVYYISKGTRRNEKKERIYNDMSNDQVLIQYGHFLVAHSVDVCMYTGHFQKMSLTLLGDCWIINMIR